MLSEGALHERMWGPYPALRKILQDKRLPEYLFGPTSVSDSFFSQFRRLIEIAVLLKENSAQVGDGAKAEDAGLRRDLDHLRQQFNEAKKFFEEAIDYTR